MGDLRDGVERVCRAAKEAAVPMARADASRKNGALAAMAKGLRERAEWLKTENREDMEAARAKGLTAAM
ncbi:MAG: gamma-glutamyl-phosphate reductase, partial [Deltaproteobacteria bacterium]